MVWTLENKIAMFGRTAKFVMTNGAQIANGAEGVSDIEGKTARVSGKGIGERPSFKSVDTKRLPENWCLVVAATP